MAPYLAAARPASSVGATGRRNIAEPSRNSRYDSSATTHPASSVTIRSHASTVRNQYLITMMAYLAEKLRLRDPLFGHPRRARSLLPRRLESASPAESLRLPPDRLTPRKQRLLIKSFMMRGAKGFAAVS